MDIPGVLRSIGLTDSETKVYLALLELGDTTRGELVNRSGIAGSKVYEVLEKLHSKGLISIYNLEGIKHFKAVSPKQIVQYIEDQKSEIAKAEDLAKKVLPDLMARFVSSEEEQEVGLLVGLKGLEIIFNEQIEMLKKGETCYVIGGTRGSGEEPVYAFFHKIHILRQKKGIITKMLYNIDQRHLIEAHYSQKEFPLTETRYIKFVSPVAINIYQDRTVIIVFGKKITSIQIISQDVADSFLEYFRMLWVTGRA